MDNGLPFFLDNHVPLSDEAKDILVKAYELASLQFNEFITPEHVLLCMTEQEVFSNSLAHIKGNVGRLKEKLNSYINSLDELPEDLLEDPFPSVQLMETLRKAEDTAYSSGRSEIYLSHILKAILSLTDSYAQYYLIEEIKGKEGEFISQFVTNYEIIEELNENSVSSDSKNDDWKSLVTCLNENLENRNPLIGREDELEKTLRVLCRKDKNNPLHIGDPGVGKTSLVYGLAKLIEDRKVPEKLQGSKIYQLDIGSLLAGTQYRGEFEKRIKMIMDGVLKEKNAIVYIDEIHNLVGAGATGEGSMDASNMLKPYLESGNIRFIGSTTYEEYKRNFAKNKGIIRRFSNIDIPEPSIAETINILKQLQNRYEEYHKVNFTDEAIEFAVKGSAKYINDRFLPDKAIDLIDEAGAFYQVHNSDVEVKKVTPELISKILAKTCKVDSLEIDEKGSENLFNLEERISSKIFGQEKAVQDVSEAVLMAKAGLTEDSKPLASLLFVGPTGVGKTEVAKVLASELGIELIRFDMSEYTEKHTVAKLIGSPAGYVGYEDGGLLTDAIRKTPNAVLLLDEIEKAHQDIYNILLQVMDYARLTDNKGNKADFRNVIIIMTSNAGAQFASQAKVGFASKISSGEAMMKQVKKTFKPEFLNRLSGTVVFNDMTQEMASLILDKRIKELQKALLEKNVELSLSDESYKFIIEKGFTTEYGARELDRAIQTYLKRSLMKEILFGKLKEGGKANINLLDNTLIVSD